jgi:hypothetical protein
MSIVTFDALGICKRQKRISLFKGPLSEFSIIGMFSVTFTPTLPFLSYVLSLYIEDLDQSKIDRKGFAGNRARPQRPQRRIFIFSRRGPRTCLEGSTKKEVNR